jgi:hypothetical protein
MGFLLRDERENLSTEYNLLREEISDRSYKTWVISIVLVVGSLLVAFIPTVMTFPLPALSILLISAAFILHSTSERISAVAYKRMFELEKELRIIGPTRMYESEIAGQWWYMVRRSLAYFLFVTLIGVYLYLIVNTLWVLVLTLAVGFIIIFVKETNPYEKTRANNNHR